MILATTRSQSDRGISSFHGCRPRNGISMLEMLVVVVVSSSLVSLGVMGLAKTIRGSRAVRSDVLLYHALDRLDQQLRHDWLRRATPGEIVDFSDSEGGPITRGRARFQFQDAEGRWYRYTIVADGIQHRVEGGKPTVRDDTYWFPDRTDLQWHETQGPGFELRVTIPWQPDAHRKDPPRRLRIRLSGSQGAVHGESSAMRKAQEIRR